MSAASVQFNRIQFNHIPFNEVVSAAPGEELPSREPGLIGRFLRAVHRAQTRRAEQEIARLIEKRGRRMTDDLERAIERHFI